MDKRISIFNLLKQEGKLTKLLVYVATERIDDPYEKTTTKTFHPQTAIDALIQQISFEALRWKYVGQIPQGTIQAIVEKKHKSLLLAADKIKCKDKWYGVYKDDSQNFQYLEREDYCIFLLGQKND